MSLSFKYDEHNKYHRFARSAIIAAASLTTFVIVWRFVAIMANMTALPTPIETWDAFISLLNDGDPLTGASLSTYLSKSFGTFLKGLALAVVIAVPLGLFLGFIKPLREFLNPIIEVLRPIAPIAWAPIFILSFGYQIGPSLVVFVGIFFPMLTNTIFGVQKLDPMLLDAARTMGANPLQLFRKVVLPSSVPYIMNGLKVGLGIGWMCIVAAELYATPLGGIGFYLQEQASAGNWPGAYSAIIIIAVLGLLTTSLAEYAHKAIAKRMGIE